MCRVSLEYVFPGWTDSTGPWPVCVWLLGNSDGDIFNSLLSVQMYDVCQRFSFRMPLGGSLLAICHWKHKYTEEKRSMDKFDFEI